MKKTYVILSVSALLLACSDDTAAPGKDIGTGKDIATGKDGSSKDGVTKDGTGTKDIGGAAKLPACIRTCSKDSDCCDGVVCTIASATQKCEQGYCKLVGCTKDADCVISGVSQGTCKTISPALLYPYGKCAFWCTKDADCKSPLKCVEEIYGTSTKVCGTACTDDSPCKLGTKCIKKTYCGWPATTCTGDSDCTSSPYDKCDTASSSCICSSDAKCQTVRGASGGTWKCMKLPF